MPQVQILSSRFSNFKNAGTQVRTWAAIGDRNLRVRSKLIEIDIDQSRSNRIYHDFQANHRGKGFKPLVFGLFRIA